jgi:hypothetical protein
MKCPKCGFVQPQNPECINCGVLIDRVRPEEERKQIVQARLAQQAKAETPKDPFSRPIRPVLRAVRTTGGVLGLLFGGWLFLTGQELVLWPYHVLFLIAYGCICLFWVLSAPIRVPVKQFAIEMLIFTGFTLTLYLSLPEAFSLGTLTNKESVPLHKGFSAVPEGQSDTPDLFVHRLTQVVSDARDLLDNPKDSEMLAAWKDSCHAAKVIFRNIGSGDRKSCEVFYKLMVMLETRVERACEPGADPERRQDAYETIEKLEKALLSIP